jgi:hypothetical protein
MQFNSLNKELKSSKKEWREERIEENPNSVIKPYKNLFSLQSYY